MDKEKKTTEKEEKPERIKVKKVKMRNAFPRKTALIAMLILLQLGIVIYFYFELSGKYSFYLSILELVNLLIIIRIAFVNKNATSKISWIILILVLPISSIAYLFWGETALPIHKHAKIKSIYKRTREYYNYNPDEEIINRVKSDRIRNELTYIKSVTGQTASMNINSRYFSAGEEFFADVKKSLRAAERFIFLEFFIVAEGRLLKEIKEILLEKAKAGVEVKLLYDDFGCKSRFSNRTKKEMRNAGIEVRGYNKLRPVIDFLMNYRDHKKIIVVDGKIAYTGGVNIADEYSNYQERYGYWKDSGVSIEGREVNDFSVMFLHMWEFATTEQPDYDKYLLRYNAEEKQNEEIRNIVCAFEDSPINKMSPAKNLFSKMINNARRYIYIMTPYLIIEDSMINELIAAAQSGVDVRIYTPGIPDKKFVHAVTRTHYIELVRNNVKIYEYLPGFLHSKVLLSDDECAFVGSVNMDYRSFYQQYECGAYYADSDIVFDIKKDFDEVESVSKKIPEDYKINIFMRIFGAFLRLFAPLM